VVIRVNGEERSETFGSVTSMLSELAIETRGIAVARLSVEASGPRLRLLMVTSSKL
jgi:hypothetical protein